MNKKIFFKNDLNFPLAFSAEASRPTLFSARNSQKNLIKSFLLLFIGMFFLLGSFGFVSAEKMWNFNNHTVNVSDNGGNTLNSIIIY